MQREARLVLRMHYWHRFGPGWHEGWRRDSAQQDRRIGSPSPEPAEAARPPAALWVERQRRDREEERWIRAARRGGRRDSASGWTLWPTISLLYLFWT